MRRRRDAACDVPAQEAPQANSSVPSHHPKGPSERAGLLSKCAPRLRCEGGRLPVLAPALRRELEQSEVVFVLFSQNGKHAGVSKDLGFQLVNQVLYGRGGLEAG